MKPHAVADEVYVNNTRVYHNAGVLTYYRKDTLSREDGVALLKYQPEFAHKDVLDIGAGMGRTAIYLAPLAHRYQAVDYSPVMVREFRKQLPNVPVQLADMRDMPSLHDSDFDFILASNNVIDAVDHEGRLRTLHEMHRLLRPGGMLMFSSHNRDCDNAVHWPRLEFSHNPLRQTTLAAHWCVKLVNHSRLRHLQSFTRDYAIINDESHDCSLLHYYIGPVAQRRQLAEQGFELLETLDSIGATVPFGSRAAHSYWLLYVARRLADA